MLFDLIEGLRRLAILVGQEVRLTECLERGAGPVAVCCAQLGQNSCEETYRLFRSARSTREDAGEILSLYTRRHCLQPGSERADSEVPNLCVRAVGANIAGGMGRPGDR